MPETVGGVVYDVEVDLTKANAKLKQFEENVAASGRRADAGFEKGFKPAAAVGSNLDKATASTKKLTSAQQAMASASRASGTALANSVPVVGAYGQVVGGVAAALPGMAVGVLAVAAGFQLLNSVIKNASGAGIIDHLFGRADDIDRANRAAQVRKDIEDQLSRLRREGLSAEAAKAAQLTAELEKVEAGRNKLAADLREINIRALVEFTQPDPNDSQNILFPGLGASTRQAEATSAANAKARQAAEDAATAIKELDLSYRDLLVVTQRFPELAAPLADELKRQADAAGIAQAALDRYSIVVDEFLGKQAQAAQAQSDLAAIVENAMDLDLGPQIADLQREQVELEQLKTKMGDAFGDANQARLVEVGRLLDLLEGKQDLVSLAVQEFGTQVRRQYGDLAPAAIANVAAALSRLPADQVIKVAVLLPDLFELQSVFFNFIATLQAGATVDVAIRAGAVAGFGTSVEGQSFLGGSVSGLPGFDPTDFPSDAALEFEKKLQESFDNLNRNAAAPLGAQADKTKEKVAAAAKATQIWADGIIDLGEALAEGLTPARAAELEMIHDAELGVWALRDAEFRLAVEREKAERGAIGLQIALVNISAELIRSNRTFAQFRLDEWLRPQIDNVRSMISSIFQQPTREGLQLQLQLKKLERQRLMIERRGGDTEQIDKQIDALQREIDIRQTELEIMQISLQLKDQTLQTDQDLINASIFLGGVLESLSQEAKDLVTLFGLDLFNAGMKAVQALNSVGAAGGTGFTAAEKHWINEIARQRGEPIPFPGFLQGTLGVKSTGLALVHAGEPILPPDVGQMFRRLVSLYQAEPMRFDRQLPAPGAGWNVSIVVNGATNPEETARVVMKRLKDFERVASYGGAQATPNWRP